MKKHPLVGRVSPHKCMKLSGYRAEAVEDEESRLKLICLLNDPDGFKKALFSGDIRKIRDRAWEECKLKPRKKRNA